jgi:hypothetical protein
MTKSTSDDRRQHARFGVFAGNAQITHVVGPKGERKPSERARILNWSRGGVLLKVPSPRRKFLLFKQDPIVGAEDMIKCVLRLPPLYSEIDVSGEVVRVERCRQEPDHLEVGVSFVSVPPERVEAMAKLLEPKPKQSSRTGRVSGRSGRAMSQRAKSSQGVVEAAKSSSAPRLAAPRKSERRSKPEATASQRLSMHQTETLEIRTSARLGRI